MKSKQKRKLKPLPIIGLAFTTARNIADCLRCMADYIDEKYDRNPYYQMELSINAMSEENVNRHYSRGEVLFPYPAVNHCGCTWIYPPSDNLEYHI